MSKPAGLLPCRVAIAIMIRGVWIELLRRQDLYVCGMFMALFVLGVGVARLIGIDAPATGTFMLNIGLSLAAMSAHVLTLLLALRQFPAEIENRSLYPLLSRPIRRSDIVVAKWLAAALGGLFIYLVLAAVVWLSVPRLEMYAAGLLLQMLWFQAVSLFWLSALSVMLSLLVPHGIALLLVAVVYFGGASLRRMIAHPGGLWGIVALYMPDFGMLNLTTRYTDGIVALSGFEFGCLLCYGATWLLVCVWLAIWLFDRRRL